MFNKGFNTPTLLEALTDDSLRESFNKYLTQEIYSSKKSQKMYDEFIKRNVRVGILEICDVISTQALDTLLHSEPLATYIPDKNDDFLVGYVTSTKENVCLSPVALGVANKLISGAIKKNKLIVDLIKQLATLCLPQINNSDALKFLISYCDNTINVIDLYERDNGDRLDIVPLIPLVEYAQSDYTAVLSDLPKPDAIADEIPKLHVQKFIDCYDFPSLCSALMSHFLSTTKYLKTIYMYAQIFHYKVHGKFTKRYDELHPQVFYYLFDDLLRGHVREVYTYTFMDTRNNDGLSDVLSDSVITLTDAATVKVNAEYIKYKEDTQKEIASLTKQLEESKKTNTEYHKIIYDLRSKEADFKSARAMKKEAYEASQEVEKLRNEIEKLNDENKDLREQLYVQSKVKDEVTEEKTPLTIDEIKELLYPYKITVVGGHVNTVNRLKEIFPDWKYFDGESSFATTDLSPDNYHVILTRYIGHKHTCKVSSNVPVDHIIYCNDINVDKILETVTDHFLEE